MSFWSLAAPNCYVHAALAATGKWKPVAGLDRSEDISSRVRQVQVEVWCSRYRESKGSCSRLAYHIQPLAEPLRSGCHKGIFCGEGQRMQSSPYEKSGATDHGWVIQNEAQEDLWPSDFCPAHSCITGEMLTAFPHQKPWLLFFAVVL